MSTRVACLLSRLATTCSVPIRPFTIQVCHFGMNTKTTVKRLPGMSSKESHSNYADPHEQEEGEVDHRSWMGKKPHVVENEVPFGQWTQNSLRCGAIGRKMGMMNVWDARGVQLAVTVVRLEENQVVDIRKRITPYTKERKVSLLVGAGAQQWRNLNKGMMVEFRKAGVEPKEKLVEFPVSLDAILPVGTPITVRHFVPGQFVDIIATSKDKGFQGAMKRHGFKGQRASHGVSLTHRQIGSTGACQNPSKIWPGKKMAGHMGANRCTMFNKRLYKVDIKRNLIFLKGSVPGNAGDFVQIKDAVRRPWLPERPPPFPTWEHKNLTKEEIKANEIVMDVSHMQDPFAYG